MSTQPEMGREHAKPMWICEEVIRAALHGLRETEQTAKRGKERTSGLMTFLAFDSMVARGNDEPVLLDPEAGIGLANRSVFTKEYKRLISVGEGRDGTEYCVYNLGEVDYSGKRRSDEKLSGDFLTVSLKRASESAEPLAWPNRPKSPLLTLGVPVYDFPWGVCRHSDWKSNLPIFLEDRSSSAKWTNLAIFILRDEHVDSNKPLQENLYHGLRGRFTPELATQWSALIKWEQRRFEPPLEFATPERVETFPKLPDQCRQGLGGGDPAGGKLKRAQDRIALLETENAKLRAQLNSNNPKG